MKHRHRYLEMIEMIKSNQNYAKNFQKCLKLLKISLTNFCRQFSHCGQSIFAGKLPAKPMSRYTAIESLSYTIISLK